MTQTVESTYRRIPEQAQDGRRLGRHVNHDPESKRYAIKPEASTSVSKDWARHIPILDQGNLGSCTGNAATMALGCSPHYEAIGGFLKSGLKLDEGEAVNLYSQATILDPYSGQYPPEDTGSDGVSVAKAAKNALLISGYTHAMSLDAMITAMQSGPVIIGVNWYSSFDSPDGNGYIDLKPGATVRGGHEICIRAVDVAAKMLTGVQSWGQGWAKAGEFTFSFTTMDRLMKEQGDATLFIPISQPAPTPTPTPTPTPPGPGTPTADDVDRAFVAKATKATQRTPAYRKWYAGKTW